MNNLDTHLMRVQEDTIQEFDPLTTALGIGSVMVIANLVTLMMGASGIISSVKVDKKLTDKLNKLLNSGNKWIVHIYPTKDPNAFSLGFGRHIFVTTELLKILDADETDAILLHEVYHSSKKHTYKNLAYKYPLFYLVAFLGASIFATGAVPILAFLAMFIANKVGDIIWNITFGRKMEYNADSYAAKLGYGKQLISAFGKIQKWVRSKTKKQSCDKWCQVITKIDSSIDEHPEWKNRVENILKNTKELSKAVKTKSFGKIKDFIMKAWGK